VMGIREYQPGDAMNRIHWPSSVRHRRLHVKEFELDKTADLWLYLDLDERWHSGEGEDSSEERCVTVAASVVAKALREHRNVGGSPPVDIDERDRAPRHAILGELAVAGIPVAHLATGAPIEELFHQSGSAVA